ncbi:MAG TPA: Fe-S cluster assembly protein SufD [Rhodanobacteraceae bacterium]|nr:Fe-S cluster assembly protein SufD [Rhodanobacteraceae bacterium]
MAGALLEALLEREAPLRGPAWLADARRAAADALAREGLPGARNEAWKYTSLRALEQSRPMRDTEAQTRAVDAALFALPVDGPRLVFVNGAYRADLSSVGTIVGASISTLGAAGDLDAWRVLLTREYDSADTAFARLNTALAADGPLIRIAPTARIEAPIHLVFVGAGRDIAWSARALIELGERASVRIVEHHVGADASGQLGTVVVQGALGAGARLDLVQVQDAPTDATLVRRSELSLADDATATSHVLEIGARLARHDLDVDLRGRGARFVSRGVFALRGRQHADTHLDIRHDARDTASDIVWRGVADERARGVFHGAITVAQGADGADANLSNKNLLLSPNAEIDTQPVLEIHADEVKAAHGATVGQLDERALFYLRSRGLPPEAARHLLIAAFCAAALAEVPDGLRAHLETMLAQRLPQIGDN